MPLWTDLKLPCTSGCSSKVTAERGTSLKFAESHSLIAFHSAWLGLSTLLVNCAPVFWLVLCVAIQSSMLARS